MKILFHDLSYINIVILILLLILAACIFMDCKKLTKSYFNATFWALVSIFLWPPIGIGIYLLYKKNKWL